MGVGVRVDTCSLLEDGVCDMTRLGVPGSDVDASGECVFVILRLRVNERVTDGLEEGVGEAAELVDERVTEGLEEEVREATGLRADEGVADWLCVPVSRSKMTFAESRVMAAVMLSAAP